MKFNEKLVYWYQYAYAVVWAHWLENMRWYYSLRAKLRAIKPRILSYAEIDDAKMKGTVLDSWDRLKATIQTQCNHRKGGMIHNLTDSTAILNGLREGNGPQYSVFKHQHINGDVWVECLRCGKKWKPPIRSDYKTEREFYRAIEEYEAAKKYETNNVTSTSVQCQFKLNGSIDAGHEYYRKLVAAS